MASKVERLWAVVEPYLAAEGIELDDLEIVGKEPAVAVRVTVDAEDGVGVDRLAEISRRLSRVFDEDDPIEGSYTLEVSSPGLERKLRRPRQFQKSVGREVKVKSRLEDGSAGSYRGKLLSASDDEIVVEVDGEERAFAYGDVISARTVFAWEKPAKPGKR